MFARTGVQEDYSPESATGPYKNYLLKYESISKFYWTQTNFISGLSSMFAFLCDLIAFSLLLKIACAGARTVFLMKLKPERGKHYILEPELDQELLQQLKLNSNFPRGIAR